MPDSSAVNGSSPPGDDEPSAASSFSLPEGVSLQDVMAALAAQSPAPRLPLTPAELEELASVPFTSALLTPTSHNARTLQCLFCSSPILLPSTATYVRRSLPTLPPLLPHLPPPEHVWLVQDQMAFENIAVTRPTGAAGDHKLLVCGNCDRGPVGLTFTSEPSLFYIAHGRVQYRA